MDAHDPQTQELASAATMDADEAAAQRKRRAARQRLAANMRRLVTASVAGSRFGMTLVWAIGAGALLKYVLSEGVARWHLATGSSVIQGWSRYLGKPALALFLVYLLIWSVMVAGGLMVASGLAASSVFPALSRQAWGLWQAIVALALVWFGSYHGFEWLMKVLVALMFVSIIGCAIAVGTSAGQPLTRPALPVGSLPLTLSLAGGVGGSVTMLVYGYWIGQKEWDTTAELKLVRADLATAYAVTGLLAAGAMLLASEILLPKGIAVEGQSGLIQMALMLEESLGAAGRWIFLVGFWGAAFSSLLGVLQGVPYLFADLVHCWRTDGSTELDYQAAATSLDYRGYLVFMAVIPAVLLFADKPIWIVVMYAAVSSLFLPILTVTLLLMNNRSDWIGHAHRNGPLTNATMLLAVGLFCYLAIRTIAELM